MNFSKRRVNCPPKTDSFFLKFLFLFTEKSSLMKKSTFPNLPTSKLIEHDLFSWIWFKKQQKNKKIWKFFFYKKNNFLAIDKNQFFKKNFKFRLDLLFFHNKMDSPPHFVIGKKFSSFDYTACLSSRRTSPTSLCQCFDMCYVYFSKPKFLSNLNLGFFLKRNLGWNTKLSRTLEFSAEYLFFSINPEFFQYLSSAKIYFKSFLTNFKRSHFSSSNQFFVSFERFFFLLIGNRFFKGSIFLIKTIFPRIFLFLKLLFLKFSFFVISTINECMESPVSGICQLFGAPFYELLVKNQVIKKKRDFLNKKSLHKKKFSRQSNLYVIQMIRNFRESENLPDFKNFEFLKEKLFFFSKVLFFNGKTLSKKFFYKIALFLELLVTRFNIIFFENFSEALLGEKSILVKEILNLDFLGKKIGLICCKIVKSQKFFLSGNFFFLLTAKFNLFQITDKENFPDELQTIFLIFQKLNQIPSKFVFAQFPEKLNRFKKNIFFDRLLYEFEYILGNFSEFFYSIENIPKKNRELSFSACSRFNWKSSIYFFFEIFYEIKSYSKIFFYPEIYFFFEKETTKTFQENKFFSLLDYIRKKKVKNWDFFLIENNFFLEFSAKTDDFSTNKHKFRRHNQTRKLSGKIFYLTLTTELKKSLNNIIELFFFPEKDRIVGQKKKNLESETLYFSKSFCLRGNPHLSQCSVNLKGRLPLFSSFFKTVKLRSLLDLFWGNKIQGFEQLLFFLKKKELFFESNWIFFKNSILRSGSKNFKNIHSDCLIWNLFPLFTLHFIFRPHPNPFNPSTFLSNLKPDPITNSGGKNFRKNKKVFYLNQMQLSGERQNFKNFIYNRTKDFNKKGRMKFFLPKKGNLTHSIVDTNFLFK